MNGVINIRTSWAASNEPETDFALYLGAVGNPPNPQAKWWGRTPPYSIQFSATHKRKLKKLDLVLGGATVQLRSHNKCEYNDFIRFYYKTRLKINSQLTVGINGNIMPQHDGMFLIWANTAIYVPFGGDIELPTSSLRAYDYLWFTLDPHITYYDKKGGRHTYHGRIYSTKFVTSVPKLDFYDNAMLNTNEYQYSTKIYEICNLVAGSQINIIGIKTGILLNHKGITSAAYLQTDLDLGKLNISKGIRIEGFSIDTTSGFTLPVYRIGANLQVNDNTYLRESAGQGFRVPSITEMFVFENLGSLNILLNLGLMPEEVWNFELGVKKVIKGKKLNVMTDLALFMSDTRNQTEFTFGVYSFDYNGQYYNNMLGFRSINLPHSRTAGAELSVNGNVKMRNIPITFIGGYTKKVSLLILLIIKI